MRKLSVLFGAFVIAFATSAYADFALPGELTPETTDIGFKFNDAKYKVTRTISKNSLDLKVFDSEEKQIWSSGEIGQQASKFVYGKDSTTLKVDDLDGDNIPEIIAGTTYGTNSELHVFKYNTEKKIYEAMNFGYKDSDLSRDFMVSDIPAADGENMVFTSKTQIRTMGKIYNEDGAVPGFYYFELEGNQFICNKIEKAPIENDISPVTPAETPAEN